MKKAEYSAMRNPTLVFSDKPAITLMKEDEGRTHKKSKFQRKGSKGRKRGNAKDRDKEKI